MKKLLIVDDDSALRKLMRLELSDTYQVIDSGEPEVGLALAMEHNPDAILLDLRMPKYSGYELCERFTTFSRTQMIPVIIVSGEAGGLTREHCKQLGATAYFEKPIDFDALRACLSRTAKKRPALALSQVRVPLCIPLKLKGTDSLRKRIEEMVTTNQVSLSGFICGCTLKVPMGSVLDVYLTSCGEEYVGKAKVAHADSTVSPFHYEFRFIERTGPWILN